ncbi:MAG: glycosyltransferase, partial [Anaerolineae bacterium]
MMRLAFLTPLPPSPSGIADYSASLLGELSRLAEIDVYSDAPASGQAPPMPRPIRDFESTHRRYDAVIYQLGNSVEHGPIYETLLRHPGIVVLHDGTLHHFFVDRTLHRGDAPAYLREMAYAHGATGYDTAIQVVRGAGIFPFYRFSLIKRAIDAAHGVIVHSQAVRGAVLAARPDAPVRIVDHFAFPAIAPTRAREAILNELGWPADALVVASFGQVTHGKRAEVLLAAFARFAAQEPRARLLWAGDLSPEYDLRPVVSQLGLASRVRFAGRVPGRELPDYLALCDIAVNLRYPTAGEASGGVMRLFAYGKPTIV